MQALGLGHLRAPMPAAPGITSDLNCAMRDRGEPHPAHSWQPSTSGKALYCAGIAQPSATDRELLERAIEWAAVGERIEANPGYFLALCLECTPLLAQPFSDPTARDEWSKAHADTGHRIVKVDT